MGRDRPARRRRWLRRLLRVGSLAVAALVLTNVWVLSSGWNRLYRAGSGGSGTGGGAGAGDVETSRERQAKLVFPGPDRGRGRIVPDRPRPSSARLGRQPQPVLQRTARHESRARGARGARVGDHLRLRRAAHARFSRARQGGIWPQALRHRFRWTGTSHGHCSSRGKSGSMPSAPPRPTFPCAIHSSPARASGSPACSWSSMSMCSGTRPARPADGSEEQLGERFAGVGSRL